MRARAVLIIAVLLVAGSCNVGGDQRGGSRQAGGAPVRGGTLRAAMPDSRVAEFQDLDGLDPQRAYGGASWELFRCCLLRTLYSYNGRPTEEGGAVLRPDLAVGDAEVASDGLTWTFRLRPGLHYASPFEDTPITALDVVRALERTARVTSPDVGYPFYYEVIRGFNKYASGKADSIVGLETPDARTLVVRLDRVTSDLGYRFSLPATAPIPEGAADGHGKDYARFLVASGPYMIEGSEGLDPSAPPEEQQPVSGFVLPVLTKAGAVVTPGSLILVRNPSWNLATDQLRAAYPDRIELTIGGLDDNQIARGVNTGKMDLVFDASPPFKQVAQYREDSELSGRVYVDPMDGFFSVSMNVAAPPFDDVHVRRAVAYAIDKPALVEILSHPPHLPIGHTAEVATHIAPDSLEGGLLRAFDPYPHDLQAARTEMRASRYDRTGDGRCDAPICRNIRTIVPDVGVNPETARAIREDLAEVGIELALEPHPLERYFSLLHDLGERIPFGIPSPWVKDYPEGAGWFMLFDSSTLGISGSPVGASPAQLRKWDYSVSSVPNVDNRIRACVTRRGVAKVECWAELDQYLMTEVVSWLPYMSLEHTEVVSERVVEYSFDQFASLPALDRIALEQGSD